VSWRGSQEVETGRNDAGIGLFLTGMGDGQFKAMPTTVSGLFAPGDVKTMIPIRTGKQMRYVIGKNRDNIQVIGKAGN